MKTSGLYEFEAVVRHYIGKSRFFFLEKRSVYSELDRQVADVPLPCHARNGR